MRRKPLATLNVHFVKQGSPAGLPNRISEEIIETFTMARINKEYVVGLQFVYNPRDWNPLHHHSNLFVRAGLNLDPGSWVSGR